MLASQHYFLHICYVGLYAIYFRFNVCQVCFIKSQCFNGLLDNFLILLYCLSQYLFPFNTSSLQSFHIGIHIVSVMRPDFPNKEGQADNANNRKAKR